MQFFNQLFDLKRFYLVTVKDENIIFSLRVIQLKEKYSQ